MKRGRRRAGFTMTEVLLALLIVLVALGLGLVSLQSTRKRAASAQALLNLRSMGGALMAHAAEFNGKLVEGAHGPLSPLGGLVSSRGPSVAFWFNALDYYMGGRDMTLEGMRSGVRPGWQNDPLKRYPQPYRSAAGYGVAVGFGWNHQYFGYDARVPAVNGTGWGSRMQEVSLPAQTIIIGTGEDSFNESNVLRNVMIYANSVRCRRHQGTGYYLFLDGHTEALTPEAVMANSSWLMRKVK